MGDCILHVGIVAAGGHFTALVRCTCDGDGPFERRCDYEELGKAVEALDELIPEVAARARAAGHRVVRMALIS